MPNDITESDLLNNYWFNGTAWLIKPPSLGQYYQWDPIAASWVDPRSISELKLAKWDIIKTARTNTEVSGFTWDGSNFDSDAISQARINGAVTLALIAKQSNAPYNITWTLKDSTTRTLSADQMIAVGLALGTHVQTIFNKGQQLQQQINAATTKEEVEAITWE